MRFFRNVRPTSQKMKKNIFLFYHWNFPMFDVFANKLQALQKRCKNHKKIQKLPKRTPSDFSLFSADYTKLMIFSQKKFIHAIFQKRNANQSKNEKTLFLFYHWNFPVF